jgi:hypothetical protein
MPMRSARTRAMLVWSMLAKAPVGSSQLDSVSVVASADVPYWTRKPITLRISVAVVPVSTRVTSRFVPFSA